MDAHKRLNETPVAHCQWKSACAAHVESYVIQAILDPMGREHGTRAPLGALYEWVTRQ